MVEISCAKCNGLVSVVVFVVTIFVATLKHVAGHGGLLEPPSRSLAWRYGFDAPINYDWMSLFCGGYQVKSKLQFVSINKRDLFRILVHVYIPVPGICVLKST